MERIGYKKRDIKVLYEIIKTRNVVVDSAAENTER